MIVVIAILGILAALAIPRLTGTRNTANRSAVLANLRTIESAIALAEANGDAITDTANDYGLIANGHLAKWPVGPKATTDATYQVVDKKASGATTPVWRAQVTLPAVKAFGFTAPATTTATLDTLKE